MYIRNLIDTDLLDNYYNYNAPILLYNLLRSTTHGPSMARLLNAAQAIIGSPGICKWEGGGKPNVDNWRGRKTGIIWGRPLWTTPKEVYLILDPPPRLLKHCLCHMHGMHLSVVDGINPSIYYVSKGYWCGWCCCIIGDRQKQGHTATKGESLLHLHVQSVMKPTLRWTFCREFQAPGSVVRETVPALAPCCW